MILLVGEVVTRLHMEWINQVFTLDRSPYSTGEIMPIRLSERQRQGWQMTNNDEMEKVIEIGWRLQNVLGWEISYLYC